MKRIKSFLLDFGFIALVVGLLYLIRWKSKIYIEQITALTPELSNIQQALMDSGAGKLDGLSQNIYLLNNLANKMILLNAIALPAGIFALWIVLQKHNFEKVSWKEFIIHSIYPFALFYAFVFFVVSFIASLSDLSFILMILFGVLWLKSIYWIPVIFIKKKKIIESIKMCVRNWKKLTLSGLVLILVSFFIVLDVVVIYVFIEGEANLIIPIIVMFVLLAGLNFSRTWHLGIIEKIK